MESMSRLPFHIMIDFTQQYRAFINLAENIFNKFTNSSLITLSTIVFNVSLSVL